MADSYGPYEWRRHKEYYSEQNGQVTFREDTPAEILESYQEYINQIDSLERFATEKGGNRLLSFLNPKKEKASASQRGLAQRFVEYYNEGKDFPKAWFAFDFVYHDGQGNTLKKDQLVPQKQDYRIVRCVDHNHQSMVFWKSDTSAWITVVTCQDDQIVQIRQYESKL